MLSSNLKVTAEKPHNTCQEDNKSISSAAASTVCQGLKSSLEPLLSESRVSMCELAPTKQGLSPLLPRKQAEEYSKHCPIAGMGGGADRNDEESACRWASIQSLTSSGKLYNGEDDEIYVHPLVRRANSSLSMRSLEMCTESLGSETGTSIIELGIDEPSSDQQRPGRAARIPKTGESCKKVKQGSSFPPPLTSISGSDGLQVQTCREGGRLVIKAFALPFVSPCFLAERENGRLRLHLVKEGCLNGEVHDSGEEKDESGNGDGAEKDGEEDEFDGGFWEGKVGCKEWSGSGRCNGDRSGSKRLPPSLPFCVAIS